MERLFITLRQRILCMISERLKIFFERIKQRLSETKHEDITWLTTKQTVHSISVAGQVIKDILGEFSR